MEPEQLSDGERLEVECINSSIQRSVDDQNLYLDRAERRRTSISSTCSTLTELSSCDSEDVEQSTSWLESLMPPTSAPSRNAYAAETSADTNCSKPAPSTPDTAPSTPDTALSSRPNAAAVDAVDHSPAGGPPATQNPPKKPRRRQKKKPKVPAKVEVAAVEFKRSHKKERMEKFKREKSGEKSKKTRMECARFIKVMKGVTPVPFELGQFRPSLKVAHESRIYRHEELEALGVRTISWDGRKTLPITTPSGYIIALLSGRPDAPSWDTTMEQLTGIMSLTRDRMHFDDKEATHRRGFYASVNTGISYGGGAKAPGKLGPGSRRRMLAVEALKQCQPFKALSGYVSKAFERNAIQLYTFCTRTLELIESYSPHLRRQFRNSPFGSTTFNFGPQVCTVPHKDLKNLSWGWCAVTSLGSYDHKKGGHLVLWDLKVAVEFPPHSTIFIPSAIIEHSNTAIQPNESRMSITSYNSAGLFRWIAYGFMPKWLAELRGIEPLPWWSQPKHMFSKVPPSCMPK